MEKVSGKNLSIIKNTVADFLFQELNSDNEVEQFR